MDLARLDVRFALNLAAGCAALAFIGAIVLGLL
jgi:hypothetical protein